MKHLFQALELLFTIDDINEGIKPNLPTVYQVRNRNHQVFCMLRTANIITATPGCKGRTFSYPLDSITLWDVFEAVYNLKDYKKHFIYECLKTTFSQITLEQVRQHHGLD